RRSARLSMALPTQAWARRHKNEGFHQPIQVGLYHAATINEPGISRPAHELQRFLRRDLPRPAWMQLQAWSLRYKVPSDLYSNLPLSNSSMRLVARSNSSGSIR